MINKPMGPIAVILVRARKGSRGGTAPNEDAPEFGDEMIDVRFLPGVNFFD